MIRVKRVSALNGGKFNNSGNEVNVRREEGQWEDHGFQ